VRTNPAAFCSECHSACAQIAANGPRGIQNIRFQPYRLATSKCYDAADKRISCTACHDPHRDVAATASAYDENASPATPQDVAGSPPATAPPAICPSSNFPALTTNSPTICVRYSGMAHFDTLIWGSELSSVGGRNLFKTGGLQQACQHRDRDGYIGKGT
jgi:hypothetical protein